MATLEMRGRAARLRALPELPASRCGKCGYGICTRSLPGRCPMCGGSDWVPDRPSPAKQGGKAANPTINGEFAAFGVGGHRIGF